MLRVTKKKILTTLANLQLAITLLFLIGVVIAIGTIIEQDQPLSFYQENYSELKPVFGFLSWKVIKVLNLDIIYTSWWFTLLLFLFGSSLLACTFTTQLPSLKTFKQWVFKKQEKNYSTLNIAETLDLDYANTTIYNINENKYHFFRQKNKGYAYTGLLGRVAPIVVHGSILVLLLGSTLGSFGGYNAQELVPRGEIFHIQNLTKFGGLSSVPQDISCRINNFWISYTKERKTDQFYSDLSILNFEGQELKRKIVFVNEPFIYKDVVFYQTDWDILGVKLQLNSDGVYQIPFKRITKGGSRFWFGTLDLGLTKATVVTNDLSGNILIYNEKGELLKQSNIGESIQLTPDSELKFVDFITSTGLQIKSDPGINTIYFSFLLLMVSIYVSFFTYSQIWFVEANQNLLIGGKSNRAVLFFQEDFRKILNRVKKQPIS